MSQHIFILVLTGHFFTSIRKDDRTTGVRRGIALRNMDMPFCKAQISRRPFPVCGTGLLSRDHPCKGWHTVCPAPRPPPATSREASQNKKHLLADTQRRKCVLPATAALPADCGCGGRGPNIQPQSKQSCLTSGNAKGNFPQRKSPPCSHHDERSIICPGPGRPAGHGRSRHR